MKLKPFIVAAAALGLTACGASDSVDSLEFEESLPTADTLEVVLDEESEPADGYDPTSFQEQAREVAANVNAALDRLQTHIDNIKATAEPVEVNSENGRCVRWEQDRERYHARLTVCEADVRAQRYAFRLEGRELDGTDDDLVLLAAGNGRVLERRNGVISRAGQVGYDFDNARALFDTEGPTGRIAIGYRRTGDARRLRIAVDEFQPSADAPVRSAFHNYLWVQGRGGRFTYTRRSDFLTTDGEGGFVAGQDGVEEGGRISFAWARANRARAAATICGGTVGERCYRVARCYAAEGVRASWEEIRENMSSGVTWNEVACPAVEFAPEDTGEDLEDGGPTEDVDGIPGPDVQEPAADDLG